MIRITLELISGIDPSRDRLLGVAHIANTGRAETGLHKYTYEYRLSKNLPGRTGEQWKRGRAAVIDDQLLEDQMEGTLSGFDNVRRGAWDLLYLVLKSAVGSRNP